MLPLKIGACLRHAEVAEFRDWLFDDGRDIEIQDFAAPEALLADWRDLAAAAKAAVAGHTGRLGIHGPFWGLALDNQDPELQELISRRYLTAIDACDAVGATQMVIHSPFDRWYAQHVYSQRGYHETMMQSIRAVLGPVAARAEAAGVTLVVENIQDVDPSHRAQLIAEFGKSIALSIDTGHAHLARMMSGAPPVDQFVRAAGADLMHVHLQDLDGYADRHWAPGQGGIEWHAVFKALAERDHLPHLVLELRDKSEIPVGFRYLQELGLAC